jgi:K+-sensing histidine kinase KdpD
MEGAAADAAAHAVACVAVALVTGLKLLLGSRLDPDSPFLLYFAAIVGSALYGGLGPGILAVVLAAGAAAYFFFPPYWAISNPEVWIRLAVFVVETLFISAVCGVLRNAQGRLDATRVGLEADRRERQRLLSEAEARRRAAEALTRVEAQISQSLDPRVVQEQIVESARELFDARQAALYSVDAESGGLVLQAAAGVSAAGAGPNLNVSAGMGLLTVAVQNRRPMVAPDVLDDARVQVTPEDGVHFKRTRLRAVLIVPLLARATAIGVLVVNDRTGRVFTDDEIALAQTFASLAATALEHARLYERAAQRADKLMTLSGLTRLMTSAAERDEVFQAVAEAATRLLGAAASRVWIDDSMAGVLRTQGTFGIGSPFTSCRTKAVR